MKCPDEITVLGFPIKIIFTSEREDVWGEWDGDKFTITINDKATLRHKQVTMLHEALHGIDSIMGLELTHKNVYAISQILYLMLKENTDLTSWLLIDEDLDSPGD